MAGRGRTPLHTGGCQCGAVRYALFAGPEKVGVCHCRMCQKAVGGPFAALAPVRRADFAWTRGAPATFRSSSLAERGFCARCGTPLSFQYLESAWIEISIGSFDRPAAVEPTEQCGLEARLPWVEACLNRPGGPTEAVVTAAPLATLVSRQHPDHDTGPEWSAPAEG